MRLYSSPLSPMGKRVRICAAEAGVALDVVHLDFAKGEARSPEYLALNPMGKVPTLSDGDLVLWESPAILAHIASTGDSALWPREPKALADTLRWLFFGASHLDPYFTTLMVERFIKARRGEPADEREVAAAERWLSRFLPVVEAQIVAREYLTGRFGLADIALGCTLELAPLVRLDLAPYPHVRGWLERLGARDAWRRAGVGGLVLAPPRV